MMSGTLQEAPKLWRRMACFVYEALMLFGLGLIPGTVGTALLAMLEPSHSVWATYSLKGLTFAVYGAYFTWCWSQRGQTLPMQTWHIKLVNSKGEQLSRRHAFCRYLACWIWILPSAMASLMLGLHKWDALATVLLGVAIYASLALLHPRKQFWHDAWCGTQLISQRNQS